MASPVGGQIGVTQTRPIFLAPRSGIRALVARLGDRATVSVGEQVSAITKARSGWTVTTARRTVGARHVVIATPAGAAAKLLHTTAPRAARELAAIRTASVALTLLAYPGGSVTLPPGSGMLVPRPENRLSRYARSASGVSPKATWPVSSISGGRPGTSA